MRKAMNSKSWDRLAKIYDGFMAKDTLAYDRMYDLIRQKVKGKTVLELATGTGLISGNIVKNAVHIEATDFSAEMIEQAKQTYSSTKLHFSVQDATNLPYADQSFDVVILANALHVMPQPEKALAEVRRVLKDDGSFIAPNFTDAESSFKRRCRLKMMGAAGFKVVSKWSGEGYIAFLRHNGWMIESAKTLHAAFPLTYVECKKEIYTVEKDVDIHTNGMYNKHTDSMFGVEVSSGEEQISRRDEKLNC